jgi:endogenous inhibitor of DNA gyrase (YacG/DUF329 family)
MSDGGDSEPGSGPIRLPRCPICRKSTIEAYRPFCSKRCADIDLARWLGGSYAIPGAGTDVDEDGEAPPEQNKESPRADD